MNQQQLLFSFKQPEIDTPLLGNYQLLQPYERACLKSADLGFTICALLSDDARIGDRVEFVLTKNGERKASSRSEVMVEACTSLQGIITVNMDDTLAAGDYTLQINLLGLHSHLKNTAVYEVMLADHFVAKNVSDKVHSPQSTTLKRALNSVVSSVLSVF